MVEDVAETVAWYERRLGAEQTSELESDGELVWAQVERDDVRFMFQRRDNMESELPSLADAPIGGSLSIYVHVDDVEALATELADVDRVLEMRTSEYGLLEFAIRDYNGYVLWFGEILEDWSP
jgi:uncharacterized glyoxalase superfamily protein PhnB